MRWQTRTERAGQDGSVDPTVYILEGSGGRACVWPAKGFNLFRWTVPDGMPDGMPEGNREIIYADPQVLAGSSPTRTGIPILFPFPNRIRNGRFAWEGKE